VDNNTQERGVQVLKQRRRLIDVREAAEYLGFHREHVRRLARQGKIKGRKIGGKEWRFRPEDLDALFEEEEVDKS
jgi:excisionase family DNA binding protein